LKLWAVYSGINCASPSCRTKADGQSAETKPEAPIYE